MSVFSFRARCVLSGTALVLALVLGVPTRGLAQTFDAYSILGAFDAIVPGTYTSSADAEGALIIGTLDGNNAANGSMAFVSNIHNAANGYPNSAGVAADLPLTLTDSNGNTTTFGQVNIANIVNSNTATPTLKAVTSISVAQGSFLNINSPTPIAQPSANVANLAGGVLAEMAGGCTSNCVRTGPAINFSAFTTPLNAFSTQLSQLATTNNSSYSVVGGALYFHLSNSMSDVDVFNINASVLNQGLFNISVQGFAGCVVINVTGTSIDLSGAGYTAIMSALNGAMTQNDVIWNFVDATSVSVDNWEGSLLAPNATVSNKVPIQGTLYAANFNGSGEIHDYTFQPAVKPVPPNSPPDSPPGPPPITPPTPAPEPATLALFGSGMAALAALRRRRNRANAAV